MLRAKTFGPSNPFFGMPNIVPVCCNQPKFSALTTLPLGELPMIMPQKRNIE